VLAVEGDPLVWLSEQVKNRDYILSSIKSLEEIIA
jgi:hypothetical protein